MIRIQERTTFIVFHAINKHLTAIRISSQRGTALSKIFTFHVSHPRAVALCQGSSQFRVRGCDSCNDNRVCSRLDRFGEV